MREYPSFFTHFVCAGEDCLEYHCPGTDLVSGSIANRLVNQYPRTALTIGQYEQLDLSLSCMEVGHLLFQKEASFQTEGDVALSSGDKTVDELRELRDQLVSTALNPDSPLEDLFALQETNLQLLERMDSMEVLTEDWAKAVHAVKLLLRRPDF
ncbi:MAG TPA: hypothetical protein PLS28_05940, partial [Clostridiales bacterium]|nr:hypothetical protein [Clostridiales bacterium]